MMEKSLKELLLRDLCARLPYGVMCQVSFDEEDVHIEPLESVRPSTSFNQITTSGSVISIDYCKPYLRPMSSMTDEERKELSDYLCEQVMSNKIGITIPPNPTQGKGIPFIWMGDCLDWLNAHHFDYRGLIEKGLALEAPKNMYK